MSALLVAAALFGLASAERLLAAPRTVAAGPRAKTFDGVIPDIPTRTRVHRPPSARIANLPYGGGRVLHANRTHVIFWAPAGSGLGYDPGYQQLIETFLERVAADSRKPTNVYGLSGQYRDSTGPAAYDSTYAGAVVATDPLPANGCTEPPTGPGWSACLDDTQLMAEIQHVAGVDRLPVSDKDIYFLVTPYGLGSCTGPGPDNCALGGSGPGAPSGGYCGYHSSNPDGTILYAIIPYNAVSGHCQSDNPRPNASTADPTISTISHEHNETVTDPLGDAWIDGSGMENGDLCISDFGPNLGGSGGGAWNEVIRGGHYYLQGEWSNDDGTCKQRDELGSISFSGPGRATARKSLSFTAHATDPDGAIVFYDWFFGNGRGSHRRHASHTFSHAGSYRVVLRTTDRSGNYAFNDRTIRVSPGR